MFILTAAIFGIAAAAQSSTSACSPQPTGYGPVPSPNTDAAFKSYAPFATAAENAVIPPLYQQTFVNLNASQLAQSTNVYMGYYELKSYDPASCTTLCDQTSGCIGTNLYFERDPTLLPAAACPNPTALTVIKCALWGSPVTAAQATNDGQYQANFHVLIAGSNGYMRLPAQACSAISSAWSGNQYSWPTGTVPTNWQGWTSGYGGGANLHPATTWPAHATAGPKGY